MTDYLSVTIGLSLLTLIVVVFIVNWIKGIRK